ncbi:MAG: hypothetical protein ABJN26_06175 [Stappiaceae bacterium]
MTEVVIKKNGASKPDIEETMPWLQQRVYQLHCMIEATMAMNSDSKRREFFNEMLLESLEMAHGLDKDVQNALKGGIRKIAH